MNRHVHSQQNETPLLYGRAYLGEGVYRVNGVIVGLNVGDELTSFTHPGTVLRCVDIEVRKDSGGVFLNKDDAKDSLVVAKFIDNSWNQANYYPLENF